MQSGSVKSPRIKHIDRKQNYLCAVDVENLIGPGHLARDIWDFVGRLDLNNFKLTIKAFEGQAGRSAFDPQLLISLWLFGYSQGIGKAREIARLCDHHPAFQWLTGMQSVSYHTLSDFRIENKAKLDDLFHQVLVALDCEGLLDLTQMFHDGSKFAADASRSSFHRQDTVEAKLKEAQELIHKLENEDSKEQNKRIEAAKRRALKEREDRLQRALDQFKTLPKTTSRNHPMRVSATDPDARNMTNNGGGCGPSFNAQVSSEGKNGFVVGGHICESSSDFEQLIPAIQNFRNNFGKKPDLVVVDSGFTSKKNISRLALLGIKIIGPLLPQSGSQEQLSKRGVDPAFGKSAFTFNPVENSFTCPAGKILSFVSTINGKASLEHRYDARSHDCRACDFKTKCCGHSKETRRRLIRTEDRPEIQSFRTDMATPESQQIYKRRSQIAEFPLAWFKEKFGVRKLHLRGSTKASIELLWLFLTYNIVRFIRIKKKPVLSTT